MTDHTEGNVPESQSLDGYSVIVSSAGSPADQPCFQKHPVTACSEGTSVITQQQVCSALADSHSLKRSGEDVWSVGSLPGQLRPGDRHVGGLLGKETDGSGRGQKGERKSPWPSLRTWAQGLLVVGKEAPEL